MPTPQAFVFHAHLGTSKYLQVHSKNKRDCAHMVLMTCVSIINSSHKSHVNNDVEQIILQESAQKFLLDYGRFLPNQKWMLKFYFMLQEISFLFALETGIEVLLVCWSCENYLLMKNFSTPCLIDYV